MNPITGDAVDCARTPNGHATAEPAMALMKSRLRTQPSTSGRATSFFRSLAEREDAVRGEHVRFGSGADMCGATSNISAKGQKRITQSGRRRVAAGATA